MLVSARYENHADFQDKVKVGKDKRKEGKRGGVHRIVGQLAGVKNPHRSGKGSSLIYSE